MTDYNNPLSTDPLPVRTGVGPHPVFSAFSLLAIVAAVMALFNVGGGAISFLLAIVAVVFGGMGMLVALLPNRRGGIISFFAVGAGLLGIVIAVIRLLGTVVSHV